MKRYGQRCPVALALDAIGERWTPLIVRELLLGPRRYSDLLEALPGLGTNMLAGRLSHLQAHGVVAKRTLAPPTPVTVYELTAAGEALGPVLAELRAWGERFGPKPQDGDAVRPAWILQRAAARAAHLQPDTVCELRVGAEVFELAGGDEAVAVKARTPSAPDAVLTIAPQVLMSLAGGAAPAPGDIEVAGDPDVVRAVIDMLAG